MTHQTKTQGIFIPSLKFEKKTKALNKYIWLPVVFLVFVLALFSYIFFEMVKFVCNIVYSYLDDTFIIVISVFMLLILGSIPNFIAFIWTLWTSYEVNEGRIVKGRINNKALDYANIDLSKTDALALGGMLANLDNPTGFHASRTAGQAFGIIALIRMNLNKNFVEQAFYTDCYTRKEYINPRLRKENRYTLVYRCDNKRRLVIPKVYEGLIETPDKKQSSLWLRILGRAFFAGACFFIAATIDVGINYSRNQVRLDAKADTRQELAESLAIYDFEWEQSQYAVYKREETSTYTSSVKFELSVEGEITDVSFQLYYNENSEHVAEELEYLLSTVPTEYNEEEKKEFIQNVLNSITGEYVYDKLETDNSKVLIGTSGGYIEVHNY